MLSLYEFDNIFKLENRNKWFELITPHIISVDEKERLTEINIDGSSSFAAFIPEELSPNYNWKFNIGDIVTDGKDIMKIVSLPVLDPRTESLNLEEYIPDKVWEYGNMYNIIRVNEQGEDIEKDDDIAYLHQNFNINQIHLASQQEIEEIFKK